VPSRGTAQTDSERGLSAFAVTAAFSGPTPCYRYWKDKLNVSLAFVGRGEQRND
jgi:hypothetical protein